MYPLSIAIVIVVTSYSAILTGEAINNNHVESDVFLNPSDDRLANDKHLSRQPSSYGANTTFGKREYGDRLDFTYTTMKDYKFLQIVTEDVYYPAKGHLGSNITFIQIIDRRSDKNGGNASIIAGGVRSRNVTLHLKSKRGYGFYFTVNIYGK